MHQKDNFGPCIAALDFLCDQARVSSGENPGAGGVLKEHVQLLHVGKISVLALVLGFCMTFQSMAQPLPDKSGPDAAREAPSCATHAYSIRVHVTNIKKIKGTIIARLYGDIPENFLKKDSAQATAAVNTQSADLCFVVEGPGSYAVSVYHDQNDNGKLDRNFIGIPKEPVGTSNNPKVKFGKPKYEQAKFKVAEQGVDIMVKIRKPF